ncbi:16S rRNA (cytosine(1402)-N(4))-methyltransferase [Candidatus Daviesbacteria bacterium RIFCSPLOWO2_01_FULL_39_12]|uniref:Ribosomal RNA small subunit methyltransferase H n=1 Tax=Candidatus Daviesbacteria bacterium RIFCSPLOWO2_01_FULL_39_12 TaxID=1797785 RepID=A0A1F5KP55_9BACT|nr:MAG: 16S rRNA (cytosine(1402)-N(4))-methyltransferase [Candidatus Daviesbacteria bacterium RIFCSPLOWO2_01_FULL_39_12]
MPKYHEPVLLREVIEALKVKPGEWYLDCTLGDGGHSIEILEKGGNVIGLDVDHQALERARVRFGGLGKFVLIQGNFRDIKNLIQQTDTNGLKFAGAIFDLGVSSLQLENPERGFSFAKLGLLDMRMDLTLEVRALDLVNALSGKELYGLFKNLGEEKYSRAIADSLVRAREIRGKGVTSTRDLADLVVGVYRRAGVREWRIHPATRVFQALRIAVNDELDALKEGLDQVKDLILKNGTILVISYHSLEDRIVKTTFRNWQIGGFGQVLTKKPIVPDQREVINNPRSRSAKMRIFKFL